MNAVVPLADGAWYYASRTIFGNGLDAPVHEDEMRFEFADDPLKKDDGKGVLRVRSATGKEDVVKEIPIRFTLDKTGADDSRQVHVVADDEKKAKSAELFFAPGGEYALILDQPNRSSKVFNAPNLPARKKK